MIPLVCMLLAIKVFAHHKIPKILTVITTYFIIYKYIQESGFIYSANMFMTHLYLMVAIWTDKRFGWMYTFSNFFLLLYIYHQTLHTDYSKLIGAGLGSPLLALGIHCTIDIFLAAFLGYEQSHQERTRKKISESQAHKIQVLDTSLQKRTEQLNNLRQQMAADFHDHTGNMLSAITRQASLLKTSVQGDQKILSTVESIIQNSNDLYSASKDFLWNLYNENDDPVELFNYLTDYGQRFYNNFDVSFYSVTSGVPHADWRLHSLASINMIFIFKEAMNNVVKHSMAREVEIRMDWLENRIMYVLMDDGKWKQHDESQPHHGLRNIEKRCERNNFNFAVVTTDTGTRLEVTVPVVLAMPGANDAD